MANGKQGKSQTNDSDIPISGHVTAAAEAGDPPPAEPQPPGTTTEETDQPASTAAPAALPPPNHRDPALAENEIEEDGEAAGAAPAGKPRPTDARAGGTAQPDTAATCAESPPPPPLPTPKRCHHGARVRVGPGNRRDSGQYT